VNVPPDSGDAKNREEENTMPAYVFVNFDVLDPERQAALVPRFQAALQAAQAFYESETYKPLRAEREKIQRARMFIVVPPE